MKNEPHFHISRRSFLRRSLPAGLGMTAAGSYLNNLQFMNSALAAGPFTDYKALVCLFLDGGNDSNNLIIPTVSSEYANYANIRTPVLAIPNYDGSGATALQLTKAAGGSYIDPTGREYALNPAMYELAQMFNQAPGFNDLGQVAPVLNMGSLVYPMTKAQWEALVKELTERNSEPTSMVYIQVTRGVAKRDHAFPVPPVRLVYPELAAPDAAVAQDAAEARTDAVAGQLILRQFGAHVHQQACTQDGLGPGGVARAALLLGHGRALFGAAAQELDRD